MARTRWLLLAFASGLTTAAAQESPHWTAEEAGMAALLRELARVPGIAAAPELPRVVVRQTNQIPPLAALRGVPDADGLLTLGGYRLRLSNAGSGASGEGFALYAWPADDGSTRTFVVAGSGEVLATDGMRAVYRGTEAPEWTAALVARAPEALPHVLTTRGVGRDGQLWLPVAKGRTVTAQLRVRGIDPGLERDTMVLIGPAAWFPGMATTPVGDAPLPAGITTLDRTGAATWTGIHTKDLYLALRVERTVVPEVRLLRVADGFELSFDGSRLVALRYAANEAAAIATLRNISSAQAQCQASGAIDVDQDGVGEYGYFAELSGKRARRAGDKVISPPVLSQALANIKGGRVARSGYLFQMFLPGKDAAWLAEADQGGAGTPAPDPAHAKARFRCYAWPMTYGRSGKRAFVIDEGGEVRAWDAVGRYDGEGKPLSADAAYGDDRAGWKSVR